MANPRMENQIVLAQDFPPALVTNLPESELKEGQTPDSYGLKITEDGYLMAGTAPSGTARVANTVEADDFGVTAAKYTYHFNRMWRIGLATATVGAGTNAMVWGAPDHKYLWLPQRNGAYAFNESTNAILTFFPVGNSMAVFKAAGAYVIRNASDRNANFDVSGLIQEANIVSANNAIELDGVAYVSNASGLWAMDEQGRTQEVSLPVRAEITTQYDLKADYLKKHIVMQTSSVTKFVYDVANNKWFDYRTSGSLFTSHTVQQRNAAPFGVRRLAFEIDKTDTTDQIGLEIAYKFGDRDWSPWETGLIMEDYGKRKRLIHNLEQPATSVSFKAKIRSIPATIKIKRIFAFVENWTFGSRSE